jgi:hypothetical protein
MSALTYSQFIEFLQKELALSRDSILIAQRSVAQNPALLPMALWQYGLIDLEQLDTIYDWLERV